MPALTGGGLGWDRDVESSCVGDSENQQRSVKRRRRAEGQGQSPREVVWEGCMEEGAQEGGWGGITSRGRPVCLRKQVIRTGKEWHLGIQLEFSLGGWMRAQFCQISYVMKEKLVIRMKLQSLEKIKGCLGKNWRGGSTYYQERVLRGWEIWTCLQGLPGDSVVKNLPAKAGDAGGVGLIPGLGRSLRGGNGNAL